MPKRRKRRPGGSGTKKSVPESVKLLAEATAEIDRHAGRDSGKARLPKALRRYERYSGMGG